MHNKYCNIFGLIGGLYLMIACSTVRIVHIQPRRGGIIAVYQNLHGNARTKAEAIMTDNCGGPYQIVEEGEFVTGAVTHADSRYFGPRHGFVMGTYTTSNTTEWRIRYICKDQPDTYKGPATLDEPTTSKPSQ